VRGRAASPFCSAGSWAGGSSVRFILGGGRFSADHTINLFLYIASSIVIIWAAENYRRIMRRLDEEEHYRGLIVDELGHRLKNKLANVYAILAYELRGNKDIWNSNEGRLRALATTDDLIIKSDGKSAGITEILKAELMPYDVSRVSLQGEPVQLPSRLALIFHELATNAAKYGAFAAPEGRLTVSWVTAGAELRIGWLEAGGPPTIAPSRRGFGKRLLERGLDPFHGRVEMKFEQPGFTCQITLSLPNQP